MTTTLLQEAIADLTPAQRDKLREALAALPVTGAGTASLDLSTATPLPGFSVTLSSSSRSTDVLPDGTQLIVPQAWLNAKGPKGGLYVYAPNAVIRRPQAADEPVVLRLGAKYWTRLTVDAKPTDAYGFRGSDSTSLNFGVMTNYAVL